MNVSRNNRLLHEINPNHKKSIIEYNSTPTKIPFQMNMTKNGKYILFAHGDVYAGFSFRIPRNINIITLTRADDICAINRDINRMIFDFYKSGLTIFENNDLGKRLTEDGERLLLTMKRIFSPSIDFKNHLGNEIANEMFLSFSSNSEGQHKSIGILDLGNPKSNLKNMKNVINLSNLNRSLKINQILLSSLLTMYSLKTSKKKTFIIGACRGFIKGSSNNNKEIARTISGTQGRTITNNYLSS
jgi:hypothetical protein